MIRLFWIRANSLEPTSQGFTNGIRAIIHLKDRDVDQPRDSDIVEEHIINGHSISYVRSQWYALIFPVLLLSMSKVNFYYSSFLYFNQVERLDIVHPSGKSKLSDAFESISRLRALSVK